MLLRIGAPSRPDSIILGEKSGGGRPVEILLARLYFEIETVNRVKVATIIAGDADELPGFRVGKRDLGSKIADLLPDFLRFPLLSQDPVAFFGIFREIGFANVLVAAPPGTDIVEGGPFAPDDRPGRKQAELPETCRILRGKVQDLVAVL